MLLLELLIKTCKLKYTRLNIPDLIVFEPDIHFEDRGFFCEVFNERNFQHIIEKDIKFVQDNYSFSIKNVARGLHYQLPPFSQGKLVTVLQGEVLDFALDLRKSSPHFGKFEKVLLNDKDKNYFWIPEGFAHGFIVLSETALFYYKVTNYYNKKLERSVNFKEIIKNTFNGKALKFSNKDLGADYFNFVEYFD